MNRTETYKGTGNGDERRPQDTDTKPLQNPRDVCKRTAVISLPKSEVTIQGT